MPRSDVVTQRWVDRRCTRSRGRCTRVGVPTTIGERGPGAPGDRGCRSPRWPRSAPRTGAWRDASQPVRPRSRASDANAAVPVVCAASAVETCRPSSTGVHGPSPSRQPVHLRLLVEVAVEQDGVVGGRGVTERGDLHHDDRCDRPGSSCTHDGAGRRSVRAARPVADEVDGALPCVRSRPSRGRTPPTRWGCGCSRTTRGGSSRPRRVSTCATMTGRSTRLMVGPSRWRTAMHGLEHGAPPRPRSARTTSPAGVSSCDRSRRPARRA